MEGGKDEEDGVNQIEKKDERRKAKVENEKLRKWENGRNDSITQ